MKEFRWWLRRARGALQLAAMSLFCFSALVPEAKSAATKMAHAAKHVYTAASAAKHKATALAKQKKVNTHAVGAKKGSGVNVAAKSQPPLRYNVPITLRSTEFAGYYLAAWAKKPVLKTKELEDMASLVAVAHDDESACLANGACLFIVQSATDVAQTGPVHYGDEVVIAAVRGARSDGQYGGGKLLKGYRWLTCHSSRWNRDGGHHRALGIARPAADGVNDRFIIRSVAGRTGEVELGDELHFAARRDGDDTDEYLVWVNNFRIPKSPYLEVLASDDDPWGKDPRSKFGGDRRELCGAFVAEQVDLTKLDDDGFDALAALVPAGFITLDPEHRPGGSEFIYDPTLHGVGSVEYGPGWKAGKAGSLWITFSAKAAKDIVLHISDQPEWLGKKGTYVILIGGYGNTRSQIRKGKNIVLDIDVQEGGNPSALINFGDPFMEPDWEDYWVRLEPHEGKMVLSVGKGKELGEREEMRFVDSEPLKYVRFVGLGGYRSSVEYKNILVSGHELHVDPPLGFQGIPANAKDLAIGWHGQEFFALAIGQDEQLYRWQRGSMDANPWQLVEAKIAGADMPKRVGSVAGSADGALLMVDGNGHPYSYDWHVDEWQALPTHGRMYDSATDKWDAQTTPVCLSKIAVGQQGVIVGFDGKEGNVYFLHQDCWMCISDHEARDISVGSDGSIFALNSKGELFQYNGKGCDWQHVELVHTPDTFEAVAVAAQSKDRQWLAVAKGEHLNLYAVVDGSVRRIKTSEGRSSRGFKKTCFLPQGICFLLGIDGLVYHTGNLAIKPLALMSPDWLDAWPEGPAKRLEAHHAAHAKTAVNNRQIRSGSKMKAPPTSHVQKRAQKAIAKKLLAKKKKAALVKREKKKHA